jgi:hypothetical protein
LAFVKTSLVLEVILAGKVSATPPEFWRATEGHSFSVGRRRQAVKTRCIIDANEASMPRFSFQSRAAIQFASLARLALRQLQIASSGHLALKTLAHLTIG